MQRKKKKKSRFKTVEEGIDKMEEDDLVRRYPVRVYDE